MVDISALYGLSGAKILLVGDFMLDRYVYGDAERLSPEAPVPILRVVRREQKPGGAGNVACALAALGAEVTCVGVVGTDESGKDLRTLLSEAGADTSALLAIQERSTIVKERLIGLAQHRHRQQMLRIDEESQTEVDGADIERLLDGCKASLSQVDLVCVQDHGKGSITDGLVQRLIDAASHVGVPVMADPCIRVGVSRYSRASLLTPNRYEMESFSKRAIRSTEDAAAAACALREDYGFGAVVVTLDRDGAILCDSDGALHLPTEARAVYDVTGAGDSFLAAMAVGLTGGLDHRRAAELANVAAGLSVERFGTVAISISEIADDLLRRGASKQKVVSLEQLLGVLAVYRRERKRIVFTNGCFDLIHSGHTSCLEFCRRQGEVVVVGLNSDASIRELKGPDRPVNCVHDRAAVLAALSAVDFVVVFDDTSVLQLVKAVRPDVLVKGGDYRDRDTGVVGADFVRSTGGQVLLAPVVEGRSTTALISKVGADRGSIAS